MKVTLTDIIKNYEGKDLKIAEDTFFSWRDAFMQTLNLVTKDEQKVGQNIETKAQIFTLGLKIFAEHEIDLSVDDMKLIKDRAGELTTPLVYGRICELFAKA